MLKLFVLFAVLTLSSWAIEPLSLDKKQVIKMCVDPDWMPFEKIENGKHIGMSADFMEVIASKIPFPIILVPTKSWSESIAFAKNRQCDIFSLAMSTPERLTYMNFTRPYLIMPLVIATTFDKIFITDIADVLDKPLGITKGYAYAELLKLKYPSINLIEVSTTKEGLARVAAGEIYGMIDNLSTIGYHIQKNYFGTLKITGRIGENWELGIGVRNDDPKLLKMLDEAIASIDNSTKQMIENRWMSVTYEKALNYPLLWKILTIMTLIGFFVFYRYIISRKYETDIARYVELVDKHLLVTSSDLKGNITEVSEAMCQMTGYTKAELIGKNHSIFRHPMTKTKVIQNLWQTINSGHVWEHEIRNRKKDGSTYWVELKITPIINAKGKVEGFKSFRYDISDKKRIEELSRTDQLTQISNRLSLENSFINEIDRAKRYGSIFSIILLDIDHFKLINDTFGHQMGDRILIEITTILKRNIRSADILGRWGGEEFLIICPQTDLIKAKQVAQKLREKIEQFHFSHDKQQTCSFGVAEYTEEDENSHMIVKRADEALYKAKNSGRNKVVTSHA